jgi:hypothetical protein
MPRLMALENLFLVGHLQIFRPSGAFCKNRSNVRSKPDTQNSKSKGEVQRPMDDRSVEGACEVSVVRMGSVTDGFYLKLR